MIQVHETLNDDLCKEAANWIKQSEFFLFATGAGWSADSGLPVYQDIANFAIYRDLNLNYKDVSQPHWLVTRPELFWGFWGTNFNSYRDSKHHEGYSIIDSWRTKYFTKVVLSDSKGQNQEEWKKEIEEKQWNSFKGHKERHYSPCLLDENIENEVPALQFFNYTSNVDAHSLRVFPKNEVFQIHGNVETWQCSSFTHITANKRHDLDCEQKGTWSLPELHRFEINPDLTAPQTKMQSNDENWVKCIHCRQEYARPAVLMFEDFAQFPNYCEECRYMDWRKNVRQLIDKYWQTATPLKIVVLEVGCGNNVQTVRGQSKSWIRNLPLGSCRLIRVNLDHPEVEVHSDEEGIQPFVMSIKGKGLDTVKLINQYL